MVKHCSKPRIIATCSKPSSLPGITIDKKRIISSTEALNLTEIPKHLIIIGGGVIGLELVRFWSIRVEGFSCRIHGFYNCNHGQNFGKRTSVIIKRSWVRFLFET